MTNPANSDSKNRHAGRRPQDSSDSSEPKTAAPVSINQYAASGDEAMSVSICLTLQEPFRVERDVAKRLILREVNVKEAFTIRDQSGDYFRASLKELGANGGSALPYERMQRSPEPKVEITLACSVLARQRMIFVIQKATELGVTRIIPLLTDHSVPVEGLEHEKASAWPNQVLRAAKQCRRGSLPQLVAATPLDEFLNSAAFKAANASVVLDNCGDDVHSDPAPALLAPPQRIVLLVGPEGGFSDAERLRFASKTRPWVLGGRILRAETAVLVGLTAVHMTWGDFR